VHRTVRCALRSVAPPAKTPKLVAVVNWFRRRRPRIEAPKLRPRAVADTPSSKVDLATLTPDLATFLGKAAYLELAIFENLSRVVRTAPSTEAKTALSQVAGFALLKHQGLTAELARHGEAAADAMEPFVAEIDRFQRMTEGNDWFESVTSCYLTAGFLDDFLVRLAAGLPGAPGARVMEIPANPKLSPSCCPRSRKTRALVRASRCGGGDWWATPCCWPDGCFARATTTTPMRRRSSRFSPS
jgi:tRNA-(MS[2]IO[6]A)-hydroxylase (MiaE)-like